MAFNAPQTKKIASAMHLAYSLARIPPTWLRQDLINEIPNYDTYLNTEQLSAKNAFSVGFQGKTNNNDLRTIDLVMRMARYLVANPQYIPVLRTILREIEGV